MYPGLEEAFEGQRRFVDDAGHELRTPITVIRGQLELLGDDPDEREKTMQLVSSELDRMSRIVEDLLGLANAEQSDFITKHPLDLEEFLDVVARNGSALGGRTIEIEQTQPAVIHADEQRLNQAMLNLVRNALEHTPESASIAIGASAADGRVALWVRDEGPGIPLSDQERIFERFSRGHRGRRSTAGAGLGLAIVRAIVEGHGGEVSLDSTSEGTTFSLWIPQPPGVTS